MKTLRDLAGEAPETRRNVLRRVGQMVFFDSLIAMLLFACAGSLRWVYGWLYTAAMVLIQLGGAFFIMPLEVLAERGSKKENTERWDRLLTGLLFPCFLSLYLIAGFDFRWNWSAGMATAWHLTGGLLFLMGCTLEMWAMQANRFFSTEVRIQFERGHSVCSRGPYQYVRHPGYLGIIVYHLFTPLLLGSLWALIPAVLVAILLIIRTTLEDRTLQIKLPGYREYATRVRYRLVPGLW